MDVLIDLLLSTITAAAGQLSFKLGLRSVGAVEAYDVPTLFRMFTNWQVDVGIALYALSTIFWLSALSKKDLSYVYPFTAANYVIIVLLSYFVLGEQIGIERVVGVLLVITGLYVIIRGIPGIS